jgi:hypothetical protein
MSGDSLRHPNANVRGASSARGILSVRGVPLVRAVQGGGSSVLGPARFASPPAWIGPPFTQTMSPTPPAFVMKSILKRKKNDPGLLFLFLIVLED